jgi:hypothetical protein
VKASNSCDETLIFGSFFIVFCQSFFPAPFHFFFAFYCLFSYCRIVFLSSFTFLLLFRHYFIPVSLARVVSSLAYPNLLGTKRLGCCCCTRVVGGLCWERAECVTRMTCNGCLRVGRSSAKGTHGSLHP